MICVCCSQSAPKLLVHVSLLLAILSGAGLATLARLKWDPSTYLILMKLIPTEYRLLSGVLCFGTFLLIALAHVAVTAVSINKKKYRNVRRALFYMYCVLMMALILVEIGTLIYLIVRVIAFLRSNEYKQSVERLQSLEKYFGADSFFVKFLNLFTDFDATLAQLRKFITEVLRDVKYNVYVAAAFVVMTAILQPLAVVLAWNAAYTNTRDRSKAKNKQLISTISYNKYNNNLKMPVPKPNKDNMKKGFKHMETYLLAINK